MSKKTRIIMYSLLVVMFFFAVWSYKYKADKLKNANQANTENTQVESIVEVDSISD